MRETEASALPEFEHECDVMGSAAEPAPLTRFALNLECVPLEENTRRVLQRRTWGCVTLEEGEVVFAFVVVFVTELVAQLRGLDVAAFDYRRNRVVPVTVKGVVSRIANKRGIQDCDGVVA
jgi:hypothetical protein